MSETSAVVPDQADAQATPRALPVRPPMEVAERGILIRSFEDLQRFAKMVFESGAAPKGMTSVGQVATAIQAGMEAGLSPMHALQAIIVINGVTSWRGTAALGLIRSKSACAYIKAWAEGDGDTLKGVCVSRRGTGPEERTEFTAKQAQRAGLWNKEGPWRQYPDRQVMWRAVGWHSKDYWSDVLGGFPIAEEAMDYAVEVERPAPNRASLPPPSAPDPLLAGLVPQPVPVRASEAIVDVPAVGAADCYHPKVPPSSLEGGQTALCPDCGEVLKGDR